MTLRVGVIGCGRMGLKHIQAYQEAGCEVLAKCDIEFGRFHLLRPTGPIGLATPDYRELTEANNLDLISIATPDQTHAEIAISALRAGKHVFVEKPAATSSAELEALREAYRGSGKHLSSNLCLRTNPEMQWLKQAILAGHYGDLFKYDGAYEHDLGERLKQGWRSPLDYSWEHGGGIHMADLILYLLPSADFTVETWIDADLASERQMHWFHIQGSKASHINTSWLAHDATALIHQFVAAVQGGDWPNTLPTAEEVFRGVEICNQIVEGEG